MLPFNAGQNGISSLAPVPKRVSSGRTSKLDSPQNLRKRRHRNKSRNRTHLPMKTNAIIPNRVPLKNPETPDLMNQMKLKNINPYLKKKKPMPNSTSLEKVHIPDLSSEIGIKLERKRMRNRSFNPTNHQSKGRSKKSSPGKLKQVSRVFKMGNSNRVKLSLHGRNNKEKYPENQGNNGVKKYDS